MGSKAGVSRAVRESRMVTAAHISRNMRLRYRKLTAIRDRTRSAKEAARKILGVARAALKDMARLWITKVGISKLRVTQW
jgi:hypothetical protein